MDKRIVSALIAVAAVGGMVWAMPAAAQQALGNFGGDLIVSSSTYTDTGFGAGTALPYNASGTGTTSTLNTVAGSAFCANANCSSNVWNNVSADANFGITSGIFLQNINTSTGNIDNTVNVTQLAANAGVNLATSFSSKSELAINLSPDGSSLTFMGYNATTGQFDVSNSNTPGALEPGNTDIQTATYRAVGQISLSNNALQVTTTNAYNGNNGRAAIAAPGGYYLVGNAGNGNGSAQTTLNTGVQFLTAATTNGGLGFNTQSGQYSITQQGYAADKTAKDNNFRGETIFNNTLYVSKGSGSNGIDTVYQVGSYGSLPAGSSNSISILPGLNTGLAKTDTDGPHPFGIWFANANTMYVADEGSGASTDFGSSPTTQAGGLDKYTLGANGVWTLDYELKGSLIGSSYTVNGSGGVCGGLSACSLTTTTDGLRNLTGQVNANGTVTLYAVTSTEGSVLGDAGADPNQIVSITDTVADTSAAQAAGENYTVLDTAALGQVYRGVAVAPVPLPASAWLLMSGLALSGFKMARRQRQSV
jgi:hypothetical protein